MCSKTLGKTSVARGLLSTALEGAKKIMDAIRKVCGCTLTAELAL
jgi:hypothetical protein